MKVLHGALSGQQFKPRSGTFSGAVSADVVMSGTDNVTVATVKFEPGGRTYWHAHEQGQLLQVTQGSGLVCLEGEAPQVIRPGDVVWIQPGERHWHGASESTSMTHVATSIGKTSWQEEVAPGTMRGHYPGESPGS